MDMRGNTSEGRGQGPDAAELRAAFLEQSRAGLTESKAKQVRTAHRMTMLISVLLGLICAGLLVVRLAQGSPAGLWTVFYALGALLSVPGWLLAKLGRTRWAILTLALGYALAAFGDSPGLDA